MSEKTCHHWRGTVEPVCGAGVNVREHVGGPDLGWCCRAPCFGGVGPNERATGPIPPCERYRVSTPEEVAAKEAAVERMVAETLKVEPLVREIKSRFARGEGGAGVEACPLCGGKLRWSLAGSNHHMHARCDTEGCVAFLE